VKLSKKPTSVAFINFNLNYQRFDQAMEKFDLLPTEQQNFGKPPSPNWTEEQQNKQTEEQQPKASLGVKAPAKAKNEEKAVCCRIF
jgi:hypothetical protein